MKFFSKVEELIAQGKNVVIAIIIETKGPTPRKTGAKLAVSSSGETFGTIGGGCIEASVINFAKDLLNSEGYNILTFDLTDEEAGDSGLICGGSLKIWIEKL